MDEVIKKLLQQISDEIDSLRWAMTQDKRELQMSIISDLIKILKSLQEIK